MQPRSYLRDQSLTQRDVNHPPTTNEWEKPVVTLSDATAFPHLTTLPSVLFTQKMKSVRCTATASAQWGLSAPLTQFASPPSFSICPQSSAFNHFSQLQTSTLSVCLPHMNRYYCTFFFVVWYWKLKSVIFCFPLTQRCGLDCLKWKGSDKTEAADDIWFEVWIKPVVMLLLLLPRVKSTIKSQEENSTK